MFTRKAAAAPSKWRFTASWRRFPLRLTVLQRHQEPRSVPVENARVSDQKSAKHRTAGRRSEGLTSADLRHSAMMLLIRKQSFVQLEDGVVTLALLSRDGVAAATGPA